MDLQKKLDELKARFTKISQERATVQQRLNELATEEVRLQGAYREIEAIIKENEKKDDNSHK